MRITVLGAIVIVGVGVLLFLLARRFGSGQDPSDSSTLAL